MINVVDRVSTYPGRVKITKADGTSEYVTWERADQPTVAGTPINKALFDSIAADIGLTADITVFVSKSGSDTLGNGSSSNPYLTIMKAVNSLPKNLNGKKAIINIAAGTYSETVTFANFASGVLTVNGVAGAGVTITGLQVQNCAVLIDAIALVVGSGGIFVSERGMLFSATSNITVNGAANGVILRYGAVMEVTTTLTINNASARAIQVQYASTASITNLAGTNNGIGVYVYQSTVYLFNNLLAATTRIVNDNGALYERGASG